MSIDLIEQAGTETRENATIQHARELSSSAKTMPEVIEALRAWNVPFLELVGAPRAAVLKEAETAAQGLYTLAVSLFRKAPINEVERQFKAVVELRREIERRNGYS